MKKQIILLCIAVSLMASCTSLTKFFPKQPRPFQERDFNSADWKNGDYQTRGEMLNPKLLEQIRNFKTNQSKQIKEFLGKPDQITKARCCYSGRGGQSGEVELWLYYVETKDSGKNTNTSLKKQDLKIYFGDIGISSIVGERDGNHDYFPAIGFFKPSKTEKL